MKKYGTEVGSKILVNGYKKSGKTISKVLYGNETVNIELEVSSYEDLVRKDLSLLKSCDLSQVIKKEYLCWDGRGKNAKTRPITIQEFEKALQDLIAQKEKVLSSDEPNKDSRYKYLEPGIKSSLDGSNLYIHGILKKETIVKAADNGVYPRSKSGASASAKRIIQRLLELPSLRWRQYKVTNHNMIIE
ncbi:hypothetical protein N9W84_01450 [bacterium]|nr:hypothetical protein [bacterium]